MKKLIRTMPEVAELVLNKCTDMSNNPSEMTADSINYEVSMSGPNLNLSVVGFVVRPRRLPRDPFTYMG